MRNRIPRQQTAGMLSDSDFSEEGELAPCLTNVLLHSPWFSAGISHHREPCCTIGHAPHGSQGTRSRQRTQQLFLPAYFVLLSIVSLQTRAPARH